MLVSIINHNRNADAISLRRRFAPHTPTYLIDSGSVLGPAERDQFDECLPNVYYSGLLNRTAEIARAQGSDDPILLVCSDVGIDDPERLLGCMSEAFAHPEVMVWAPCAKVRSFRHMNPQGTGGTRRVSFTDGFCFAARRSLFDRVCPVDTSINRIGWGPDVQFAYVAAISGGLVVVDDRVEVGHDDGHGYSRAEASLQYLTWRRSLPLPARLFHVYARREPYHEGLRSRLLISITASLHKLSGIWPTQSAKTAP